MIKDDRWVNIKYPLHHLLQIVSFGSSSSTKEITEMIVKVKVNRM